MPLGFGGQAGASKEIREWALKKKHNKLEELPLSANFGLYVHGNLGLGMN